MPKRVLGDRVEIGLAPGGLGGVDPHPGRLVERGTSATMRARRRPWPPAAPRPPGRASPRRRRRRTPGRAAWRCARGRTGSCGPSDDPASRAARPACRRRCPSRSSSTPSVSWPSRRPPCRIAPGVPPIRKIRFCIFSGPRSSSSMVVIDVPVLHVRVVHQLLDVVDRRERGAGVLEGRGDLLAVAARAIHFATGASIMSACLTRSPAEGTRAARRCPAGRPGASPARRSRWRWPRSPPSGRRW